MSSTTSDNKWNQVITNDNEWYKEWQRVTSNDSEWQRVMTNDNEWSFRLNSLFLNNMVLAWVLSKWKGDLQQVQHCVQTTVNFKDNFVTVPLLPASKEVTATFGPITIFKQQSLSFHVVSKTFITQNYLVFITRSILCFSCLYRSCLALSCTFSTQR